MQTLKFGAPTDKHARHGRQPSNQARIRTQTTSSRGNSRRRNPPQRHRAEEEQNSGGQCQTSGISLHVCLRNSCPGIANVLNIKISRRIIRQIDQYQFAKTERVELFCDTTTLWRCTTIAHLPLQTHILVLPFQFTLPSNLLPSCHGGGGTVGYSIEVVGVRPGFRLNERIRCSIPVLPPNLQGAKLSRELKAGWAGDWRIIECSKNIRRGIWGDYSHVGMMVRPFDMLRSRLIFSDNSLKCPPLMHFLYSHLSSSPSM